MNVLVLGINGMIGSTMFRVISEQTAWSVRGTVRGDNSMQGIAPALRSQVLTRVDLTAEDALAKVIAVVRPDVVVNCAGLTKHRPEGNVPLSAIAMNALLPHRLAEICTTSGARLIHISTDCVFSGTRGNYTEKDTPDATDIYGRTKALGEISGPERVTLRTSTIGHELNTKHGLLEWFLSQSKCSGYTRAIFSGLPSVVFARIVRDIVIPDKRLCGLYHVGGSAIAKADLLALIAIAYETKTEIIPAPGFVLDRSLDSALFMETTGYNPPAWPEMIRLMHDDYQRNYK